MCIRDRHLVGLGKLCLCHLKLQVQGRNQLLVGLHVHFDLRFVLIKPCIEGLLLLLKLLSQALILYELLLEFLAVLL